MSALQLANEIREKESLIRQNADLREHASKLAAMLADAAGYLASVRTDRRYKDPQDGMVYCGQTRDWADGARQFAERANELLEAHDEKQIG